MNIIRSTAAAIASLTLLFAACGEDDDTTTADDEDVAETTSSTSSTTSTTEGEPTTTAAANLHASGCEYTDDNTVTVTPDCIDPWPLTADSGEVYCPEDDVALVRIPAGEPGAGIYPLNGFASTFMPDLPPLEDVWRENPEIDGTRINIGPLTDIALDLC